MKQRGFTIIELLVVITIIGVLASIILPRLGTVREKGADSLVKTNFSSMASQAEILLDVAGDYSAVCSDSIFIEALEGASDKTTGVTNNYVCSDQVSGWAAAVPLAEQNQVHTTSGVDYWCVEKGEAAKLIDTQISVGDIVCS